MGLRSRGSWWLSVVGVVCCACSRHSPLGLATEAASASASAAVAVPSGPFVAQLDAGGFTLAGARVPADPLEMRGALARARGAASTLEVTTEQGADPKALWALLYGALGTELTRLLLQRTGELHEIALHPSVPADSFLFLEQRQLKLVTQAGHEQPLVWTLGDESGELAASHSLSHACASAACRVAFQIPEEAGAGSLLPALESWRRVSTGLSNVHWSVASFSSPSRGTSPSTIQAVVRADYGEIRKCYEAGLTRNPNLEGKLKLRFVIERDGRVREASDSGAFPDAAVRDCVVRSVSRLRFPASGGGVTTVVYPIDLSPG